MYGSFVGKWALSKLWATILWKLEKAERERQREKDGEKVTKRERQRERDKETEAKRERQRERDKERVAEKEKM